MKNVIIKIFVLMLALTMLTGTCYASRADLSVNYTDDFGGSVKTKSDNSKSSSNSLFGDVNSDATAVKRELGDYPGKIVGTVQWVGYIIAIIMIACAGIKYVMAGAGEKAKAKETLVPILIGAVLIAGAATIAKAIFGAV